MISFRREPCSEGPFYEALDQHAAWGRTADIDGRTERGKGDWPIRRRVGVSEAAADGAAVADRTIGDGRRHLAQHLAARKPQILQTGVGHAGADAPGATHVLQSLQRLEP